MPILKRFQRIEFLWTYARRLLKSIDFLILFFLGPSNCLQNSFIAYRHWQHVCVCVWHYVYMLFFGFYQWMSALNFDLANVCQMLKKFTGKRTIQPMQTTLLLLCAWYSVAIFDISVSQYGFGLFYFWFFFNNIFGTIMRQTRPNWKRISFSRMAIGVANRVSLCRVHLCTVVDLCAATRLLHTQ